MKLFVATLVVLVASSIATVSAVGDSHVNVCIWEQTDEDELEFYDMLIDTSTTWEDIEAMGIALHGMYEGITCDQLSPTSGLCGQCPLALGDCALENASDECDAHLDFDDITTSFMGGKCKYSCPKNHCKISTKLNKDTASRSWDSTNKAADDIRRNLRTNRVLSGLPDVEIDEAEPCSTKSCEDKCPGSITTTIDDVEHTYLLDVDACVAGSDEGECTYIHEDYENDTNEEEKEFCVLAYDLDGNLVEYEKESLSTEEQAACVEPLCELMDPEACTCTIDGVEGPDIGLCDVGKICTGKSDKEEYECVDPTDPEEEKKETIYCIKGPDDTFHEGDANVLQYMLNEYSDQIKQSDKKNGPCMKFANALCKKPETLEPTFILYHTTYKCIGSAAPAP